MGVALLLFASIGGAPLPSLSREKSVWNYDGGLTLETDGAFPDGPCFRVKGRVSAPNFFDDLKRIDRVDSDTVFRRGTEKVTQFPDRLTLAFVIYDLPCSVELKKAATTRTYLTRSQMSSLNLYLYWKRGVEMRPVLGAEPKYFSVDPVIPAAPDRARNLPQKLEWAYEFTVPSSSVPLTDSLVLILRGPDGHMAARGAARM